MMDPKDQSQFEYNWRYQSLPRTEPSVEIHREGKENKNRNRVSKLTQDVTYTFVKNKNF